MGSEMCIRDRIDPEQFFPEEAAAYVAHVKAARTIEPGGETLIPGEPEERMRARRLEEGIPLPEEGDEAVVQAMLAELRRNPDIAREWYPSMFAEWEKLPAQVRDPLIARHMDADRAIVGLRDMQNARRIQEEVTNEPALPYVPVTVLTGMEIDPMPGTSDEDKHAFNQIKLAAHAAFVSSVPQGEHRVLQNAGHLFYTQRPDVVVDAVFDILDRIARSSRHR